MTSQGTRWRDWFLLLACNFIWASQFVLVKIVQAQMGPIAATSIPMALSTIILIPIVTLESRRSGYPSHRMPRADIFQFILIGVLGQVVAQLFITWGMRYAPASNAALLMLALPVSTAVMAYLFLGERMTTVRWISFILAIAGVLECSGIDWRELNLTSSKFLLGNILIFASVNGSAFYNAYSKKLLARYTPLQVLLYSYYAVTVFLIPITLYSEPEAFHNLPHFTTGVWLGLLALAVFQYCLSMVIFLTVLTRLDATQASLSNYLIPFFGVVIAAIALHEKLTKFMLVGGVLVLASTLLVTVYEERQRARSQATSATTV
jgi:drug/metabolite transporter (DMT)-like permease